MAAWSLVIAALAGSALAGWSPISAAALVTGTACGLINAFLTMRSSERLADHRSPALFAISSILRIGVFGIVPVEFALHGPAWTIAAYFVGFFLPLALYAALVARSFRTE